MAQSGETQPRAAGAAGEHALVAERGRTVEHGTGHAVAPAPERGTGHAVEPATGHAVEHGTGHAAEHGAVLPYDPMAEPSAEWGWHGGFPRATRIGGWAIVAILLLMLIGNHRGRVEDLWLVVIAVVVAGFLVRDQMRSRTAWRR